jgi:hypothetical protein
MKRIVVATLFGLLAGSICSVLTFSSGYLKFTAVALGWILLNRTVMGFAIGASALKLHWAWNGIVTGLIVGEIFSYYLFMNFGWKALAFTPIGNALFGFLIELFTTKLFKAPAFALPAPRIVERAVAA